MRRVVDICFREDTKTVIVAYSEGTCAAGRHASRSVVSLIALLLRRESKSPRYRQTPK